MFAIIGIVIVFGAIVGGYLMENGKLAVLVQPAELLVEIAEFHPLPQTDFSRVRFDQSQKTFEQSRFAAAVGA